jgi:hypothetical protein
MDEEKEVPEYDIRSFGKKNETVTCTYIHEFAEIPKGALEYFKNRKICL